MLTLNENELKAILDEVESDLNKSLAAAKNLSKADPEPDPEEAASAGPGVGPSASPEASPVPEGGPGAGGPPAEPSAGPEGEPGPAEPGADPSAGGPGEDLESKLMALPEPELRHLYMAAKQALFARMQQQSPSAAPAGPSPSPGGPPVGPGPGPSPAGPPAFKAERPMAAISANGGGKSSAVKVTKSEDVAKMEKMEQTVDALTKAVTLLAAPVRKAITSVAQLPKPGTETGKDVTYLSKSEVTAKLTEKTRDPSLSKADRALVNGFYCGRVDLSKIAHLLQ